MAKTQGLFKTETKHENLPCFPAPAVEYLLAKVFPRLRYTAGVVKWLYLELSCIHMCTGCEVNKLYNLPIPARFL